MDLRNVSTMAALIALTLATPAAAQRAAMTPAVLEQSAIDIGTGKSLWSPAALADDAPVAVVISLPLQVAYVYRGPTLVGVASVSTGKAGKETPTGTFRILQKKTFHRSNLYSNAPMPFMQRLTWDGIALHAGDNPGYPASHGCIRFPSGFAKQLFAMTDMGGTVVVTDEVAVAPPGGKAPRLVPPPGAFSFGNEPIIASRMSTRAQNRSRQDPSPSAHPVPRLVALGFEPAR